MTANREDYLKQIYKLGGAENFISNKHLAFSLNVSPPSVSEMIAKLSKEGLVTYEAYKGVKLTEEGRKKSVFLARSHRLWEVFLIEKLGYDWSDAHIDAELLEHVTPERLEKRLYAFLGKPKRCPHGEIIPDYEDMGIKDEGLIYLSDMDCGKMARLTRVKEEKELLDYLQDLGVVIGSTIKIINKGEYEGNITFEMIAVESIDDKEKRNSTSKSITVSHKAAQRIFVREND